MYQALRPLCLFLILTISIGSIKAQKLQIKRSTIAASGTNFISFSGKYLVSSVVSQSSLINSESTDRLQVTQGFLQPITYNTNDYRTNSYVVFPNPSDGNVTLLFKDFPSQSVHMTLYGTDGRLIKDQSIVKSKTIFQLHDLPQGVYFLNIRIGNRANQTLKVILK